MNGMSGQPIFILPEGTTRNTGKDAQSKNIGAAKTIAETIRTTLGPKGMDKMLVDTVGDITITNDGATILNEMEIEHPAAKMMVEIAKTQEDEVGDGTTTAVIVAGELLKESEKLLEQNIHPTIIINGFRNAKKKALEIINELATEVDLSNEDMLKKIAMTAMTGKGSDAAKFELAELAVKAVKLIASEENGKLKINKDDVKIEKAKGSSIEATELIEGVTIDKEVVHSDMPKYVENAKIALLDAPIEVKDTETNAEIRITDPNQLQGFLEQESKILKKLVEDTANSGCNVLFCQKGIDDNAQYYLAKKGITAVRRVKKSDMEKLAKATGAKVVSSTEELSSENMGEARIVEEKKISGENMVFVRECKNPKAVSILVRGGTEHVVDEAKRAMDDAVLGIISTLELGKLVSGGGSVEIELARRLREYADSIGGREQLAINAFADAIEVIPKTLASSTGRDPIDILVNLRAEHEKGNKTMGIDIVNAKNEEMLDMGIVEPLKIKTQAINSSTEAAELVLRIDDVITSKAGAEGGQGAGAPAQMGGMGGGMPGM